MVTVMMGLCKRRVFVRNGFSRKYGSTVFNGRPFSKFSTVHAKMFTAKHAKVAKFKKVFFAFFAGLAVHNVR